MRKTLIFTMTVAIGLFLFAGVECLAADEIKVGAVQPLTGRFAFAGVHINAGLEDALQARAEEGVAVAGIQLDLGQVRTHPPSAH